MKTDRYILSVLVVNVNWCADIDVIKQDRDLVGRHVYTAS